MTRSRPGFPALLLLLLAAATPARPQEGESIRTIRVQEILKACEGASIPDIWKRSDELAAMGAPAKRAIQDGLREAAVEGRLAGLRALIQLGSPTTAVARLLEIAQDEKNAIELRLVAIDLAGLTDDPDAEEGLLDLLAAYNPRIRLAAATALWQLGGPHGQKAKDVLREFLKASDPELTALGAIALARINDSETPGLMDRLQELRREPGLRGQLADALYQKLTLKRTLDGIDARADRAAAGRASSAWTHLDEIRSVLRKYYDLQEELDDATLRARAAEGMLSFEHDPHTMFLSPEQYQEFLHGSEGVDPSYGGIGAFIDTNVTDSFRILRPIFGGPAWKADLRGGDDIIAVNGEPTFGRSTEDIIKQVKGPPGTEVLLTIRREGLAEPLTIPVIRAKIVLPTVFHHILPGDVGYLRIQQFAYETGKEMRKALAALEDEGARGLVIDLRDNPGGLLGSVLECLTPFLREREMVCSARGRNYPMEKHFAGLPDRERRYPISVLVNERSASGAELMSGVLQHYSKSSPATSADDPYLDSVVLGSPTFGKGTMQHTLGLQTWKGEVFDDELRKDGQWSPGEQFQDQDGNGRWDPGEPFVDRPMPNGRWDEAEPWVDQNANGKWDPGESFTDENADGIWNPAESYLDANANQRYDYGAAVKLTVARYYLPDGRNFTRERFFDKETGAYRYRGGVVPDVAVENARLEVHALVEWRELEQKGVFRDYVKSRWAAHRGTFRELAWFDGRDPSRYPDFEAFYASLGTHLDRQDVRRFVRLEVRREVANELGTEIQGDLSDDDVLRRGAREVLARLGDDPEAVAEYRSFPGDAEAR